MYCMSPSGSLKYHRAPKSVIEPNYYAHIITQYVLHIVVYMYYTHYTYNRCWLILFIINVEYIVCIAFILLLNISTQFVLIFLTQLLGNIKNMRSANDNGLSYPHYSYNSSILTTTDRSSSSQHYGQQNSQQIWYLHLVSIIITGN